MLDLMAEHRKMIRRIDREAGLVADLEATQLVPLLPITPGLYNIHKRSLPVSTDKIVGIGFTMEQASQALLGLFKAKAERGTVVYYDIVAQDASLAEKSPLFNKRPFIIP